MSGDATGGPVCLVSVVEGPELWPECAFIAGGVRRLGLVPKRVATDFCTTEEGFQAAVTGARAVLLPYATEYREIVLHQARIAREVVEGPVIVLGDGVAREPLPAPDLPGVTWHPGGPDDEVATLLGIADGDALEPRDVPMDLEGLGDAPELRAQVASLFGEVGTLALLGSRGAGADLSPTAMLARCEAPVAGGPVDLSPPVALAPLEGRSGLRRVEWWDRDAREGLVGCVQELSGRDVAQTVRLLPGRHEPSLLRDLRQAGVDRVVFEVDRLDGVEPLPGTSASAEDLVPWVEEARHRDLGVGILLVVGVPDETRARATRRTEVVRSLAPDRIRCIPFEATGGTPAHAMVRARGLLPETERSWQRELHRPLRQAGLGPEDFVAAWAEALDLLAEVEVASTGGTA